MCILSVTIITKCHRGNKHIDFSEHSIIPTAYSSIYTEATLSYKLYVDIHTRLTWCPDKNTGPIFLINFGLAWNFPFKLASVGAVVCVSLYSLLTLSYIGHPVAHRARVKAFPVVIIPENYAATLSSFDARCARTSVCKLPKWVNNPIRSVGAPLLFVHGWCSYSIF